MGNQVSSSNVGTERIVDREGVIRELWRSERAVLVLPITPNLGPLRVLTAKGDGFHDVGSVHSLCKSGKDDLKDARLQPQRRRPHRQAWVFSDDDGALARALVGAANADAWFATARSIEVRVPDCEVREVGAEAWAEMLRRFHPDVEALGQSGRRVLFIVQKVLLVSRITITATGLHRLDPAVPVPGVNLDARLRGSVAEVTLWPAQTSQKLPVAFTARRCAYDKFGIREADEAHCEVDADGEEEGEEEEEEEEEQDATNDAHMGAFVERNIWFASLLPVCSYEILPRIEGFEDDAPGERQEEEDPQEAEEEHVAVQNMEDID